MTLYAGGSQGVNWCIHHHRSLWTVCGFGQAVCAIQGIRTGFGYDWCIHHHRSLWTVCGFGQAVCAIQGIRTGFGYDWCIHHHRSLWTVCGFGQAVCAIHQHSPQIVSAEEKTLIVRHRDGRKSQVPKLLLNRVRQQQ